MSLQLFMVRRSSALSASHILNNFQMKSRVSFDSHQLTTSFLTRASRSETNSLSSAIRCRSSGRLSLFLNLSSVPSNLDVEMNEAEHTG